MQTQLQPIEDVLTLLRQQAELLGKLESLADRQRALVTRDDVGPLLAVLSNRQKLTQELEQVGHVLAPVKANWAVYCGRSEPRLMAEAQALLADNGAKLRRIIDRDDEDVRMLTTRKKAVATQMRATHSTGQAIHAYRAPVAASGRLDLVDEEAS